MGLLEIISKGIKAMIDEATTPESFKIGEKFEDYVREFLFTDSYYDILERTHSYNTNKDYVESSLKPDFSRRGRCFSPPTTRIKDYLINLANARFHHRISAIFHCHYYRMEKTIGTGQVQRHNYKQLSIPGRRQTH
ncbi:MAG: hypothetical protein WDN26_20725 [Chitinophagaceae bacterium]